MIQGTYKTQQPKYKYTVHTVLTIYNYTVCFSSEQLSYDIRLTAISSVFLNLRCFFSRTVELLISSCFDFVGYFGFSGCLGCGVGVVLSSEFHWLDVLEVALVEGL